MQSTTYKIPAHKSFGRREIYQSSYREYSIRGSANLAMGRHLDKQANTRSLERWNIHLSVDWHSYASRLNRNSSKYSETYSKEYGRRQFGWSLWRSIRVKFLFSSIVKAHVLFSPQYHKSNDVWWIHQWRTSFTASHNIPTSLVLQYRIVAVSWWDKCIGPVSVTIDGPSQRTRFLAPSG